MSVFSFTPLGGLGEIGKNMAWLECEGTSIVLDAGLMFPDERALGVDYVIPDFNEMLDRLGPPAAVLLTHGHEDHIGAVPYLLQKVDVPVYGTRFTLGLLRSKLAEFPPPREPRLVEVKPGEEGAFSLGPFRKLEYLRVTHSIVDSSGVVLETPAGIVVHTGDFKIDHTPVDGSRTDLARFAEYGRRGVDLLLSDSTNVEREGTTLSERVVGERFRDLFPRVKGRIVVACFASNVHRIQQAVDAARACGRKVVVLGRSMVRTTQVAREQGFLDVPEDAWLAPERLKDHPPSATVVVTTGSQGEPLSVVARLAFGEHRDLSVGPGDLVILSARTIPGNERAIGNLVNHLYRRGAEVLWERTADVHASGHACREELKTMLSLVRPRYFVPVHGEYRHLVLHAKLAESMGIPAANCYLLENGDRLVLEGGDGRVSRSSVQRDYASGGAILVDGESRSELGEVVLRDRRHLSQAGVVVVLVTVDSSSGAVLAGPDLVTRGFWDPLPEAILEEARDRVRRALEDQSPESREDWDRTKEAVRKSLQKFFSQKSLRRPLVLPVVTEV